MNINKPSESTTLYVRDLNANDRFVVPGQSTIYVCSSRYTSESRTSVTYRVLGDDTGFVGEFIKPNLATVYVLA